MDNGILILLLLVAFNVKHFLADFVWQFEYMILEKGIYGAPGGIHHSGMHAFFTFGILVWINLPMALVGSVIDFIIHYHTDWAKQQTNKGCTPNDAKFWMLMGFDQMVHHLTYLALIGLAIY